MRPPDPSRHLTLGPGAEFDAVRVLLREWGATAVSIGDDAAVLDVPTGTRLVVSTDASVEDVHFRRGWIAPDEIGWRSAQAALSDLAAMGASPLGILVALSVPASWRVDLAALAAGIGDAASSTWAPIVGGDVTDGERLSLVITVLGHVTRPLSRAGARPDDLLFVTGEFGGPGAAVAAWERGTAPRAEHRARFARPAARIAAGVWLSAHGAHAAIDVSDGLAGELSHLAAASGVRCVIDVDAIPCVPGVASPEALTSGEEYELLVAVPAADAAGLVSAFDAAHLGVSLTAIGRVEETSLAAGEVIAMRGGVDVPLGNAHDHFATR